MENPLLKRNYLRGFSVRCRSGGSADLSKANLLTALLENLIKREGASNILFSEIQSFSS